MKIFYSIVLFAIILNCYCGLTEINDSNYHDLVYSSEQNWILTFTLPTCPHCKKAIDSISKVSDEADEEGNEKFRYGKINCSESNYLCITYNIQAVPHIVKIINGRKIIMKQYPSYETIKSFLFVEHDENEGEPTPNIIGVLDFGLKMMQELIKASNEFMNRQLKERGFAFEWNSYMTVGLFISILLAMIGLEILIILCFCSKRIKESGKVNPQKKDELTKEVKEQDNNKELNAEQVDEKKEVKEQDNNKEVDEKKEEDKKTEELSAEDKKNQ